MVTTRRVQSYRVDQLFFYYYNSPDRPNRRQQTVYQHFVKYISSLQRPDGDETIP